MLAAAAARPVSVRCPTRAPVPCNPPSSRRVVASFPRRAEENSSVEDNEFLGGIRDKWDAVENKSSLLLYAGGAIFTVWLSSSVVRAVGSVPLLPDLLELVRLSYSGWFVYRYLLFQENRQELASHLDALKKRIIGNDE